MISPIYNHDNITIYHANNRDIIKYLGEVDHVITDPPYGNNAHIMAKTNKLSSQDHKLMEFDYIKYYDLFNTIQDISFNIRRWFISFIEWRYIAKLEYEPPAGLDFIRFAIWLKTNPMPQISADRPSQGWEGIAVLHNSRNKMRWNAGGKSANYTENVVNKALYSTQKPLVLIKKIILDFTDDDDLILDPFMGSGTTLLAAKQLNRRAIGIDISEEACRIAIKRLSQSVMEMK